MRLNLNRLTGLLLLSSVFFPSFGGDLKGVVLNSKHKPRKEVKLWRKNTMDGVMTDSKGQFQIAGITPADTIVIAVSDKLDAVFQVKEMTNVTVTLDKKFYILDNGVTQDKRDYVKVAKSNYNSNVLVREQIVRSSATSIYELLRGAIAGVNVTYGDNGQMISIRGGNSLSLDSEPLFIVDGAQYESSSDVDAGVSVNDIVRIEVLKDGSAYGMKGANGAIIITTLKAN
ncbi:MAG: TonB-dependent receptor plug domain-containing protein [Duncaniella sp.]|nr:TonB-dependent receptor plug domain-containing protein [Duncaniella sp.]